jgi:hypothetical protein
VFFYNSGFEEEFLLNESDIECTKNSPEYTDVSKKRGMIYRICACISRTRVFAAPTFLGKQSGKK